MAPLGLYIHVPFCSRICKYCNFNRGLLDDPLKARYVAAVRAHIERVAGSIPHAAPRAADTIYFGGGTPSLLTPAEIAAIIDSCRQAFDVAADAEVTMEVNPETASPEALSGFRDAGVNRLSIGVQSFRDDELMRLGRIHDQARARRAVGDARTAGFDNVSIDLMMWLPGQSLADWRQSIEGLVSVAPDHASLYMLELYPNAPLHEEMARAHVSQAPDDDAADMYELAMEMAGAVGLAQYEISNVARPGYESTHNLKYWMDGEWFGFGPGAHSTVGGVRWKAVSATEQFVSAIEAGSDVQTDRRVLSPEDRWQEALITGLRLVEGVGVDDLLRKYGLDIWARYGDHLQPYLEAGLLRHEEGRLYLSRQGMLLANEVLAVFI
ncbi:MAG: radical SAM family heme chaperone HemW [Acidobacteria bacterium]|nr:radical SAM family heme chaperone HemW [Acidobacteriota bacterium]